MLTMVRSASARKTAAQKIASAAVRPTVYKATDSPARRVLKPATPRVPGFAPGTIMQLDSRTGAGQMGERTYEEVAPAPVTTGAAQTTVVEKPEKSSLALPALIAAALYFMG